MRWLPKRFPEWKWNVQAQGTPIVATWLQGGCPIGRSPFLLPPYKWPRNWSPDRSMFLDLLLGRWSSRIGVGWPLLGGIRPNPNTFSAALNETRSRVNFLDFAFWTWVILFGWLIHGIRSCKDPKAHVKDISESWREAGLVVSFVHCFSEVSQTFEYKTCIDSCFNNTTMIPEKEAQVRRKRMADGCLSNVVKYALFLTNFLIFVSKYFSLNPI